MRFDFFLVSLGQIIVLSRPEAHEISLGLIFENGSLYLGNNWVYNNVWATGRVKYHWKFNLESSEKIGIGRDVTRSYKAIFALHRIMKSDTLRF